MKNLLVVFVVLTIFFSLFVYMGTHTLILKDTPFYWVAKDMGSLFGGIWGGIRDTVYQSSYPTLTKWHILKSGRFVSPFSH